MPATHKLHTLTLCALGATLLPLEAAAQSYAVSQTTSSFSSIASTGTSLSLSGVDDASAVVNAPFAFPYFGTTVASGTSLYVNSNGSLHIGTSHTGYSNTTFPTAGTPSGFMAPFWMDLRFPTTADGYWRVLGDELIVEWSGVDAYNNTGESISFQVRISSTGTIRYAYGPSTAATLWDGASIGLEDVSDSYGASAACTPSCQPTDVPPNTVIVFTPGAAPSNPDLSVVSANPPSGGLSAGASYPVGFEVANLGMGTAGANRVALLLGESAPVTTANGFEVTTTSIPSLGSGVVHAGSISLTVPPGTPSGTLAAALVVDPDGLVSEGNEGNNVYQLGTFTIGGGSGSINITTSELPPGTLGIPYDVQLQQTGGTNPSWSLLEGPLPPGLTLSSSGRISGTPSQAGNFSLLVEATESGVDGDVAELLISIQEGGSGSISVSPSSLPDAMVGVAYAANLSAAGGTAPYAFQVISGRPDWMQVSSDGSITGTPTGPGEHTMTVSVFDAEFVDGTAVVSLRVIQTGALEVVSQVPAGVAGRDYRHQVVRGGIPPYQVSIIDGQLPSGMAVDPNGILVGVPGNTGQWQITLQVTDTEGSMATGQFVLQATEFTELTIVSAELGVNLRADVSVALEASGGVPPYTWSIVQGSLQPGLGLDPQGYIVGRVEEASTATVTFSVQDVDGQTAQRAVPVVARGYRNTDPSTMRTGGRGGGCVCVGSEASTGSLLLGFGLLLFGLGRVRRRDSK